MESNVLVMPISALPVDVKWADHSFVIYIGNGASVTVTVYSLAGGSIQEGSIAQGRIFAWYPRYLTPKNPETKHMDQIVFDSWV